MKKLFLWTFAVTLLCSWSIAVADTVPGTPSPVLDTSVKPLQQPELSKAEMLQLKEAALAEMTSAKKAEETALQQESQQLPADAAITLDTPGYSEEKPPADPNRVNPKPRDGVQLQGGEDCATAEVIPGLPFADNGYTCDSADDYDEPCEWGAGPAPDRVYSYSPAANEQITISLCNAGTDYDTRLWVYEDNCGDPGSVVACNDDACAGPDFPNPWLSKVTCLSVTAGHIYYIVVDGYIDGSCGNYTLTVEVCEGDVLTCPPGTAYSHPYSSNFGTAATSEVSPNYKVFDNIQGFSGQVCDIHFWGLKAFFSGGWAECAVDEEPMLFNVEFWPDDGTGHPDLANPTCQYLDVPGTGTDTGVPFAFTTIWRFDIPLLDPCCTIQDGWVSVQGSGDPNCWFLWLNTLDAPGDGHGLQLSSSGFADLTYDLTFCLTGEYTPTYGACCDDDTGDCQDNVELMDCPPPLRFTANTLCADLDPPCGQQTGACCFEDGSCLDLTSPDCAAQQGNFQGYGTTCDPNPCPQPPPPNDLCENAIEVGVPSSTQGNTVWANPEALGTCGTTDGTGGAVWYYVIGTGNTITATTCNDYSDFDTKIRVWCGTCDDLICVGGNDDDCDIPDFGTLSTFSWCSEEGQQYYILVHGWSTEEGNFQLDVSDDGVPCGNPPLCEHVDNDNCEGVVDLGTPPVTVAGTTTGFLNDYGPYPSQPACWFRSWYSTSSAAPDVTYKVTITHAGEYTFTMCNSVGYDQAIEIYNFTCPTEPIYPDDFVCGNDDLGSTECPGYSLRAGIPCLALEAGEYLVVVDGYGTTNNGPFILDIFECIPEPEPCTGDDLVYSNGLPLGDYGGPASQCAPDYPFGAGAADDVVLESNTTITKVETWISFDAQGAMSEVTGVGVTVYADNDPTGPGGEPNDLADCSHSEYFEGGIVYTEIVPMGLVGAWDTGSDCPTGVYHLMIDVTDFDLEGGVTYWFEVAPVMPYSSDGSQCFMTISDINTGVPAQQIFAVAGLPNWQNIAGNNASCPDAPPAGTNKDIAFCLHGIPITSACDYIPGDPDCSGTPLELNDVITMIAQYRGGSQPCYSCPCPPHGDLAVASDPDGSCVPLELNDVVTEICAYRGTCNAAGCPDCPPPGRLVPGGNDTSVVPSLKSKIKINQRSNTE